MHVRRVAWIGFVKVKVASKRLHERGYSLNRELEDEVDVVRRTGYSPVIAHHRAGDHVRNAAFIEPTDAVDEEILFRHCYC